MTAALFGLLSALSWGIGDFAGGLSSRKVGAYHTLMYGETIGLIFAFMLLPFLNEPFPDSHTIKWSIAAGLTGTIGLLAFFEAMRLGQISIIAPLAALIGAIIPVIAGSFIEGLPQPIIFLAFALAFLAVVLISLEKDEDNNKEKTRLLLPLIAGTCFDEA